MTHTSHPALKVEARRCSTWSQWYTHTHTLHSVYMVHIKTLNLGIIPMFWVLY